MTDESLLGIHRRLGLSKSTWHDLAEADQVSTGVPSRPTAHCPSFQPTLTADSLAHPSEDPPLFPAQSSANGPQLAPKADPDPRPEGHRRGTHTRSIWNIQDMEHWLAPALAGALAGGATRVSFFFFGTRVQRRAGRRAGQSGEGAKICFCGERESGGRAGRVWSGLVRTGLACLGLAWLGSLRRRRAAAGPGRRACGRVRPAVAIVVAMGRRPGRGSPATMMGLSIASSS